MTSAAMAVALVAIPKVAAAHSGNNDPNVVHACIGNISKIVRVVGVGGVCISSPPLIAETPAHWGIQGPAGAPGINGTNGAPGVNGANGINGIDGASVTFVDYFSGNQGGCPNGGAIYSAGNPPVHAYVCNGKDGQNASGASRAAGPCFDNSNRYIDCGNGTVTDTVTGLIWLKQTDCLGSASWMSAIALATALKDGQCGLSDGSSRGDWRLPTFDEWILMIQPNCTPTPPQLADDAGTGCAATGTSSFVNVASDNYWSGSNAVAFLFSEAWYTNLGNVFGGIGSVVKSRSLRVWPVRGGTR